MCEKELERFRENEREREKRKIKDCSRAAQLPGGGMLGTVDPFGM